MKTEVFFSSLMLEMFFFLNEEIEYHCNNFGTATFSVSNNSM